MTKRSIRKDLSDQRAALIVAIVTNFVMPFSGTSLVVAIPSIGVEFRSDPAMLGWIMSAFILSATVLAIPFGKVGDIWGRRKLLFAGIAIFSIGAFAVVVAPTFEFIIMCRVLQGIGAAMLNASNLAILIDIYPNEKRGKALGMAVSSSYLGMSAGPFFGGLITSYFEWRIIVVLIGLIAAFAFAVAIFRLPKQAGLILDEDRDKKVNLVSILLYMFSIMTLMYGFTTFGQNVASYVFLAVGLILVLVFVWRESRVKNPIIEVRLWKNNANYIFLNFAALLSYSSTYAVGYLLSIYLQMVKGYSPDITGIILIISALTQALFSPFAGKLSDKKSPYKISTIGMVICVAALISFSFIGESTSLVQIIIGLVVVGLGVALFTSPNTNAILSTVESGDYGMASSILSTMRNIGQMSCMAIASIVFFVSFGKTPIDEVSTSGMSDSIKILFVIFVVLCVLGTFFSMQWRGTKGSSRERLRD